MSAAVRCKSTGTSSYFVKAVMSNTSTAVVDYSAVKSQLGCLTA